MSHLTFRIIFLPLFVFSHQLCFLFSSSGSDDDDDDDEVPPLSAIYPLSRYEDAGVVASMNSIHTQLNGGGENMALKDEVGVRAQLTLPVEKVSFSVWVGVNLRPHNVMISPQFTFFVMIKLGK